MSKLTTLALLAALCVSCRSSGAASDDARDYVLVVLRRGPRAAEIGVDERSAVLLGHLDNITRLSLAGELLVAGPFGQPNPDPTRAGLFILDVDSLARAEQLVASDPAVAAGLFCTELTPLRTRADLRRAHDADVEAVERGRAQGLTPDKVVAMYTYTTAVVAGGARARTALEGCVAPGGVLLVGELGGERAGSCFALLDASKAERADELLAGVRGELGSVEARPWWGSETLRQLGAWSGGVAPASGTPR